MLYKTYIKTDTQFLVPLGIRIIVDYLCQRLHNNRTTQSHSMIEL